MTDGKETQWTSMYEVYADGFDLIYPASKADIGKKLPSTSGLLASCAKTGDIVFYNFDSDTTRSNKITHVAIVHDKDHIIHTANNTEKCCIKPISYGDGHICAVIRLRADATPPTFPELRKGSSEGWAVRALQAALNLRAGSRLVVDGIFGSGTETALQGFSGSTTCTQETWAALGFPNVKAIEIIRDLTLTDPYMRGDDVRKLQTVLTYLGYDLGKIDGVYGNNTDKALRAFQTRAKAMTYGICDNAMRELLGLEA